MIFPLLNFDRKDIDVPWSDDLDSIFRFSVTKQIKFRPNLFLASESWLLELPQAPTGALIEIPLFHRCSVIGRPTQNWRTELKVTAVPWEEEETNVREESVI